VAVSEIKVADLMRIEYRPGDTFLLRVKCPITEADAWRLKDYWQGTFPGSRVVVLGDDIEVALLRPEDAA
jgi:hypothetical protein